MKILNSVMQFFAPSSNYQTYRKKVATCEPPLIPFFALILSDLTFIEENDDIIHRSKKEGSNIETKAEGERIDHISSSTSADSLSSFPDSTSSSTSDISSVNSTPSSSTSTIDFDLNEESEEDCLIHFGKMELLGKVLSS